MKGFLLSLQSEFYKSRKTLGFWSPIILPLIITFLVFLGFFLKSEKFVHDPPMMLWLKFSSIPIGIMGSLLLPMFVVFIAYSVNSIEHKADTWKMLFTLPISKWAIYSAKFVYTAFLVLMCMMLFATFTIGWANLLAAMKPELKFGAFHMEKELYLLYFKLFLASLGIVSLQFLLSLLWKDFLKPMGIGFVGTIAGVILSGTVKWEYAYLIPFSQPLLAIMGTGKPHQAKVGVDLLTKEVSASLIIAIAIFIIGYFIVQRKSVK
ncbi:ABC transporter permease [Mucilaginibacter lacusdianchii]|uniref:ABC transporter permease n=1 Tax=Mucilaginibacter lacusdianchii TaxID=2684211 RepID=UPI00131D09F2|nr:ABC transporter permease [Mucilaginibacter sp. JXJ CY 39]